MNRTRTRSPSILPTLLILATALLDLTFKSSAADDKPAAPPAANAPADARQSWQDDLFSGNPQLVRGAMQQALKEDPSEGQALVWMLSSDSGLRKQSLKKLWDVTPSDEFRALFENFVTALADEKELRLREIDELTGMSPPRRSLLPTRSRVHIRHATPRIPYPDRVSIPSEVPGFTVWYSGGTGGTDKPGSDPTDFPLESGRLPQDFYLRGHHSGWNACLQYCAVHAVGENLLEQVLGPNHDIDVLVDDSYRQGRNQGVRDCARILKELKSTGLSYQEIRRRCDASNVDTHPRRRIAAPRIVWTDVPKLQNYLNIEERFVTWATAHLEPWLVKRETHVWVLVDPSQEEVPAELNYAVRHASYAECELIWLFNRTAEVRQRILSRMISLKGDDVADRHRRLISRIAQEKEIRLREVAEVVEELKLADQKKAAREKPRGLGRNDVVTTVSQWIETPPPSAKLRIEYPAPQIPESIPSIAYLYSATESEFMSTDREYSPVLLPYERVWLPSTTYLSAHFEGWRQCLEICAREGLPNRIEHRAEAAYWNSCQLVFCCDLDKHIHHLGVSAGTRDCAGHLRRLRARGMPLPQLRSRCQLSSVGQNTRRRPNAPPPEEKPQTLSKLIQSDKARAIERNLGVD